MYRSYFSVPTPATPGILVNAVPVVDAVPTVHILTSDPPTPITLETPIATSGLGGEVDSPIVVLPIAVNEVVTPSSSRLYDMVITL